jgi:UDP-N-acetylglucosamine--N-acetylmuramyl-(pentapeptide) pyrophosphoryl-undecaprenol N-acetylglucosamine transferase
MTRRASSAGRAFAIVSGGGTGGHVSPALAIGEALVKRGHAAETIYFVGARRGIERMLVPEAGFPLTMLPGRGIARKVNLANIESAAGIALACAMAVGLVARLRPSVVLTVGGYAGLPAALAAILLRVPLVAVHIDAVPGAANRLVAGRAAANAVAFPGTAVPRSTVTGPPVRESVLAVSRDPADRRAVREELRIDPDRALVVVTGGSLGAASVNRAVVEWCSSARDQALTVYHVAGERNLPHVQQQAIAADLLGFGARTPGAEPRPARPGDPAVTIDYRLVGFERRLPALLGACDVAVARAGASTVAELATIGVPSVLVPLPGAPGDHQTHNAAAFVEAGAAVMLPDVECTGARLAELLSPLLTDAPRREAMASAARGLGHRDAADRVAALAESVAKGAP